MFSASALWTAFQSAYLCSLQPYTGDWRGPWFEWFSWLEQICHYSLEIGLCSTQHEHDAVNPLGNCSCFLDESNAWILVQVDIDSDLELLSVFCSNKSLFLQQLMELGCETNSGGYESGVPKWLGSRGHSRCKGGVQYCSVLLYSSWS